MEPDSAMERLQDLQRDLIAFTEQRLPALDRLSAELDATVDDLRKLLGRKRKSEESRKQVNPSTAPKPDILKLQDEEYRVTEEFRQAALQVSDELDLDELEAAKLCIDVEGEAGNLPDTNNLPYRALLRFQRQRFVLLDCLRLLLLQTLDLDAGDEIGAAFQELVRRVVQRQDGQSSFWQRCLEGLTEVEGYLKKISDHQQTAIMTGVHMQGDLVDALLGQRLLLVRQHECLASVMSYLMRGGHVDHSEFRSLLSRAAAFDGSIDVAIHYLAILNCGAAQISAEGTTSLNDAKAIYNLFRPGPNQQQWKMPTLKAVATVMWLAEYSARFIDPTSTQTLRVADRQKDEEERSKLFQETLPQRPFHFLLAACQFLKPEIWYDPAKVGLIRFLLEDTPSVPEESVPPSPEFADLMMSELQAFSDAFITNMPDDLRRMQTHEDDRRRTFFSRPAETEQHQDFSLERFLVIVSYAYQDNADAAQDFWSDRESNLYGFLTWTSKRLPTPRVAAFCELLRAIASDEKSGNQAHLFLLEDTTMSSGRLRKTYSVSWSQIFAELELYASSVRNKAVNPNQVASEDSAEANFIEPETYIMLEAYLRLASHICRISPDARNWILRGQSFHLGETLFQLASTGNEARVHASCFDLLSALLTDKVTEVNDGMWVLLDNWIAGGAPGGGSTTVPRPAGRPPPERQYLMNFATNFETATGLVNLLNALITPSPNLSELTQDTLPFPENLGAADRHAGIDAYVDFVLDTVFKSTQPAMTIGNDRVQVDVLRCACLNFICLSLSTFNEDLVALANIANVAVDTAIKTTSLAAYTRLHPFARVMEWMFNNNVIHALASAAQQNVDDLNSFDPHSPRVQAALRSVQAMNLAMKLQATYLDIVRPFVGSQASTRSKPLVNSAFSSYDDVVLSQLNVVADVVSFAASNNVDLGLESLSLLEKLCASRKLSDPSRYANGGRLRLGNRLVSKLADTSEIVAAEMKPHFQVFEWDLETGEQPLKLIKARAVVDVLNSSLDTAGGRPSVAHCLLGFTCSGPTVSIDPNGSFSQGQSLFHSVAAYAAQAPYAIGDSNVSWLLSVKRGCADIILKLALSPLTAAIVLPELRTMEYLSASSQNQLLVFSNPLWDQVALQDPTLLLDSSAKGVEDFLRTRRDFFEYGSLDLRTANEAQAYSVQEKIVSALLGTIKLPTGEQASTVSVFDLFDFFDLDTAAASTATTKFFKDTDFSMCVKDDAETTTRAFDLPMVEQLLILRKREMLHAGLIKEAHDEQQVDDEVRAILASLTSQNNFRSIQAARLTALEAWTDLLSLMSTSNGLSGAKLSTIALQGLQVILPRFERALSESLDAAALLARLTLTLVPVAAASDIDGKATRNASLAHERLLAAFRVCLKVVTDSGSGLALRDICYRTCCAILAALPLTIINGQASPSPNAKQLLQLVQTTGERLITVVTEDAFSGRGVTRVSALLFLDGVVALFQLSKATTAILRALSKLNFLPVLLDQSLGSVTTSFQSDSTDQLTTAVAYFHTSLALLLRITATTDGTQLVLNSGLFPCIADSKLFSTDPDIGLDIDNPAALREFYRMLAAVLRVVTAVVMARGPANAHVLQQGKAFLQENRFSMQAVFKRTSAVQKTAGPPEEEALQVAEEFGTLLLVTGFLEV